MMVQEMNAPWKVLTYEKVDFLELPPELKDFIKDCIVYSTPDGEIWSEADNQYYTISPTAIDECLRRKF